MGSSRGAERAREARRRRQLFAANAERLAAGDVVPLQCGVDTLHMFTKHPIDRKVLAELETAREASQGGMGEENWATYEIAGHLLRVRPFSGKFGPFLLGNEHLTVTVNPNPPRNLPTAIVELRALFLWGKGYSEAGSDGSLVLQALTGIPDRANITRLDVCLDFQGWVPPAAALDQFVYRCRQDVTYRSNRTFTGFEFGKGELRARLYDKTTEIADTDKSKWVPALWASSGRYDASLPVWRLEYQLRREGLTGFAIPGVEGSKRWVLETWERGQHHLGDLWGYCTQKWLSLRAQRTNGDRQQLDHRWTQVQQVKWFMEDVPERRILLVREKRQAQEDTTIPTLAGYLARAAALRAELSGHDDLFVSADQARVWQAEALEKASRYATDRGDPMIEKIRRQTAELRRGRLN